MNEQYFNLREQTKPTNQDLAVTYTPPTGTFYYQYQIYCDNVLINTIDIEGKNPANFLFNSTGIYQIKIVVTDYYNNKTEMESGFYHIDKEKPILTVKTSSIKLKTGDSFSVMDGITAHDSHDGDIIGKVTTNFSELDLTKAGSKKLTYMVSDTAGNVASSSVTIQVVEKSSISLVTIQIILLLFLIGIVLGVLRYRRSVSLEHRIGKYGIEPLKNTTVSFMDKFFKVYRKIIRGITKVIDKSVFLTKTSHKYDKYTIIFHEHHKEGKDLLAMKFLVSFVFLVIAIVAKALQYELLSMYEICIPLVFGFFTPNVVFWATYKIHRNKIENDLLQAIIIMNNAFKSGRSITQAISLVATELDGAIRDEFKKMQVELAFGLGVDVVFKRFSDRIQLEEVTYLTASLTILNRTGGNIIKVFDSIERSLFNKKKLKLELSSLTSSSKIIVNVLFAVPILFVIFISVLDPSYFMPFINNQIGLILLGIMIIYYMIYIFCVRRIMKVRM